jgi:heterogeneous nuclear ribonucleoprotein L
LIDVTPPPPSGKGTVMMVYGLPKEKLNADRLFNLFAQYGNVNCIKFLKNKEDCAMIQMGSAESVERCLTNFQNIFVFNSKLELGPSKQEILNEGGKGNHFKLWDGSPSFKSYTGSIQNRFMDPRILSKNRILPPSNVLYFYNVPPKTDVELIRQVFIETAGAPTPKSVKIVEKNLSRKSCSGVAEFSTVGDAVEALALVNYYPLNNPEGGNPFLMKLRFSWVEKSGREKKDEETA